MRDLIIRRQAFYIRRLELKVDDLKMQLSQQSLSNDVQWVVLDKLRASSLLSLIQYEICLKHW